jgi:hypothetical protein
VSFGAHGTSRIPGAAAAIAALAAAAIFAAHASAYFFLLDDFIITAQVSSKSIWQLLTEPQFDFYRPVSDLWLKGLFALFRWDHPSAYIVMSLAVHAACAALVGVLARMCGLRAAAAAFGGVLFFLSPWGTEPILWVAASCDSLPALGLLGAIVCGLALVPAAGAAGDRRNGATPARRGVFALGVACAIEAALAKETGVLAPVLVALAIACVRGWRALRQRRVALYVIALAAIAAAYLAYRQSILPGLGGGYGTIWTLFAKSSVASNARAFAITLLVPPHADLAAGAARTLFHASAVAFAVCSAALLLLGFLSRWRVGVLCAAAGLASIAPVLWASLAPGNTSGNRFLYLPGVWFAVLAAAGAERRGRALIPVVLGVAIGSVLYQSRIWRAAFDLSRTTAAELRQYEGTGAPLFVTNLPGLFADGPYVLSPLALSSYFGPSLPPVDANAMALKFIDGESTLSYWLGERRDPRPNERAVTLDLPVWTGESRPFGAIEAPAPGADVTQPFTVRGWTIDAGAREGTGVESVRVYARPVESPEEDATPLGTATYGDATPDLSRRFGERFASGGFHLEVSGLRPGRYRILVNTRRPLARGADVPLSVDVLVR